MKSDLQRFGRGFVYAWNGICAAVRQERNFRFHICAALYAYAAAFLAELDPTGFALVSLCVFAVMGMELMNSAVERAVDKPDTSHWWSAGAAKDMAAGAVLLTALGAVCVAVCLFGNAVALGRIAAKVMAAPWLLLPLAASLAAAYCFIFRLDKNEQKGEKPDAKQ